MSTAAAGTIFIVSLIVALAVAYRFFGDYMYRVVSGTKHSRVERLIYRTVGVNADAEQSWGVYARSVLAFSAISILFLYAFMRLQNHLWLALGLPAVTDHIAWNTAVSFTTNTNWQAYSGESTMGHLVQMAGLAVQNFVSAAVGIAVAIALVRGFARRRTDQLGNFWVDLTRITLRILLPICVIATIVLIIGGAVQNLSGGTDLTTLTGGSQHITGGPVASQEAIKDLGTNGGGFYNVNSAHPFENPTSWTNWIEIFLLLCISFSLPRVFGRMVKDNRQGYAIVAIMAILALTSVSLTNFFELDHGGTVPQAVGAATEGKEVRFDVANSATFAASTTLTSTGSVDSFHDSYTALGGMIPITNMMLGEVVPGGTGSGLYGMLILATITVFVAGLMVGRTPEYIGKKIGAREIKFASMYFLATPMLVLIGTAAAFATGNNSTALNVGPHGLSEVLYAFTSASNNNGSAFAGITVNTTWWDTALGLAMLFGRLLPIIFALGLAGALARQQPVPASAGTLPTHKPLFVSMVVGVTLILVPLSNREATEFLPVNGVKVGEVADAAQLSSLADETPEGRSIVVLAKNEFGLRARDEGVMPHAHFVPFSAESRMSGVDIESDGGDTRRIRKGAAAAVMKWVRDNGGHPTDDVGPMVDGISASGGTPLVVAERRDGQPARALGVIHLKDIVKQGMQQRFDEMRRMGIRTVMITGDNPLTAEAIAREAGVDDFLAEAKPEEKLALIRKEQEGGRLVAMTGDGTNDAPALAQADVGVAMNTGTSAAKEAGNMVDLDSDPTKLIEIVEIGKQLLITRGALTTFSIANDIAKYFAIIPAIFATVYPSLDALNIMHLHSPTSAILSAIIFNALIIIALIPLALRGVRYKPSSASALLTRNLWMYGLGGVIAPFIGIKLLDVCIVQFIPGIS